MCFIIIQENNSTLNIMEKILDKIDTLNRKIVETKKAIEVTTDSPFYTNFSFEHERQKDLKELNTRLKTLYSFKYSQLDSLIIAINLEKCDISEAERNLTLKNIKL